MKTETSVALCKFFAITNLIFYVITASVVNLVITFLMLGYVILFEITGLRDE
jgi:hypothetical protein